MLPRPLKSLPHTDCSQNGSSWSGSRAHASQYKFVTPQESRTREQSQMLERLHTADWERAMICEHKDCYKRSLDMLNSKTVIWRKDFDGIFHREMVKASENLSDSQSAAWRTKVHTKRHFKVPFDRNENFVGREEIEPSSQQNSAQHIKRRLPTDSHRGPRRHREDSDRPRSRLSRSPKQPRLFRLLGSRSRRHYFRECLP